MSERDTLQQAFCPIFPLNAPAFVPTESQIKRARSLKIEPLILFLLEQKSITGTEQILDFLYPSLEKLPAPFTMLDMKKAAECITEAIYKDFEILVWGDYDVDGVTATALLVSFLKVLGVTARYHIPNRFKDGYGLNKETLLVLSKKCNPETTLILTVDCGISNEKEITFAKGLGFQIIITDHHEPGDSVPSADAILNPKQEKCGFLEKNLAGVGVAFYLAAGVRSRLESDGYFTEKASKPNLKQFLDFVAIGTIADLVPLTGANRILVKAGFESLVNTSHRGVEALLTSCDIFQAEQVTSDDIAFQIGPKINAAGRMGEGELAVELLLCQDLSTANTLAKKLTKLNARRRKTCSQNLELTLGYGDTDLLYNDNCIVHLDSFHLGVVGIVASQLVDRFNVPVLLLAEITDSKGDEIIKGSGRSTEDVNLYDCLNECKKHLLQFGGHKMAAGVTLKRHNIEIFKKAFAVAVERQRNKEMLQQEHRINMTLPVDEVFQSNILFQISLMEPFGEGNKRPVFLDSNPVVCSQKFIGKDSEHVKMSLRGKYRNHEGVGFGIGKKISQLRDNGIRQLSYTPMLNRFKNRSTWKVKIIDIA